MSGAHLRPLALFLAVSSAVTAVVVLGLTAEQDFTQMSIATLVVTVACTVLVILRWGADFTRAPLFYLVLFSFFHFGLIWTMGLIGEHRVAQVSATALYWLHTPYLRPAVTTAALGTLVYSLVVAAAAPRRREAVILPRPEQALCRRLGRAGAILQIVGIVVLALAIARAGGLSLIGGGYLAFLEAAQDSMTGYAIWAVGIGASLSQLGDQSARRLGLAAFGAFALVFFPLGLRGSVLFPACVLLATRSITGRRTPSALLFGATLVALAGSAVVRTTRVRGGGGQDDGLLGGVVSTITELGFSIRPTAEVLRWADAGQEPSWFISFVAVPVRFFEGLTGLGAGAPAGDQRLFNVKVNDLVGAIGGSPVAEGFDAAGIAGVVIVMAAVAVTIGWASRGPFTTAARLALFPVVVLPITIAVRNSFAPVLTQVLLGLLVVALATQAGGRQALTTHGRDRTRRPGTRSSPLPKPAERLLPSANTGRPGG